MERSCNLSDCLSSCTLFVTCVDTSNFTWSPDDIGSQGITRIKNLLDSHISYAKADEEIRYGFRMEAIALSKTINATHLIPVEICIVWNVLSVIHSPSSVDTSRVGVRQRTQFMYKSKDVIFYCERNGHNTSSIACSRHVSTSTEWQLALMSSSAIARHLSPPTT